MPRPVAHTVQATMGKNGTFTEPSRAIDGNVDQCNHYRKQCNTSSKD